MKTRLFFDLYADRSDANFRKVFNLLLQGKPTNAGLMAITQGVSAFPELLKDNEKSFLKLFERAMDQFLDPEEGLDELKRMTIFSFLPVFEEMRSFLFQAASRNWDISFSKKMKKLFEIARGCLGNEEVKTFFEGTLPKLAEKYPLTMRTLYTEIKIHNRNALKVEPLPDIWVSLEETYESLQKKH